MSTNLGKIAQNFLIELQSNDSINMFNKLVSLIEFIENKSDPDPTEIRLAENIYHFIEKLKILESNIKSYVQESQETPGSKLSELYDMGYETIDTDFD
ncbi:MAG: hypothetical protein ACTSPQ_21100 [Candidatus Helarchaeota archaeon]